MLILLDSRTFLIPAMMSILLTGCLGESGPALGTVTGIVLVDESPLEGVQVIFTPDQGRPSVGFTQADGKYELRYNSTRKGAELAQHTVSIEYFNEDNPKSIAEIFNTKSTLTAEVKPGRNTFDFSVQCDKVTRLPEKR